MKRLLSLVALFALVALPLRAQYAPQFGASVAVSDDMIFAGEGRNLLLPGTVYLFARGDDGAWAPAGSLMAPDASGEPDGFGRALVAAEGTLVVGAPDAQAVYVYTRGADDTWTMTTRLAEDAEGFGAQMALAGDALLVGAPGGQETPGTAFVYHHTDGAWTRTAELATAHTAPRDGYGTALALADGQAVIGAPGAAGRMGAVYAFTHDADAGTWSAPDSLIFPMAGDNHRFGSALLLGGPHLAIGAPGYEAGSGTVAVFVRDAETGMWTFDHRLAAFEARGGEQFGATMALAYDKMWIGAPGYGAREGRLYEFTAEPGVMRMGSTRAITPEGLKYRSGFAGSLAAHGEVAVAGAAGHDNFEGALFPFRLDSGGWVASPVLYNDAREFASVTGGQVDCEEGDASGFSCEEVDMVSFLTRRDVGAKRGIQVNDVWGWTDPETEREYALVGRTDGTSFIDLSDPANPVYLGDLPMTEGANQSIWRDVKVYQNHAYIVSDGAGPHHMQIFDLTQLRDLDDIPATFTETAIYKGIYSSHNIVINEDTGFAYAVGSDSGGESCGGALHMIDIRDPVNPVFAGCFADTRTGRRGTGTTHDAQCVTYHGPDLDYQGREICLSSNGTALSIADVTDKSNPVAVSIADYPNVAYTHQGWLTEDHRYFYLNDEGDEVSELVDATRTLIFDLTDLDEPLPVGEYLADHSSIDHNLYIKGNLMYQTNYSAGLRIVDITDPESPREIAHFDTVPYGKNDNSPVLGAWSNYPFFKSGVIVVTSGREGVFFLKKKQVDI